MKTKKIGYILLIPMLFVLLFALNVDSAEAAPCFFSNLTTSGIYAGDMNLTVNISDGIYGAAGVEDGIENVTFFIVGNDGIIHLLGTTENKTVNPNQTVFEFSFDTTDFPDQTYTFAATCTNETLSTAETVTGTTTNRTGVVINNTALFMSWTNVSLNQNTTTTCIKSNNQFTFMINGSSDEMVNANPIVYLQSRGSTAGFTHSFTMSRTQASDNFTTVTNLNKTSVIDIPEDNYFLWVTYEDTDGTKINVSQIQFESDCDSKTASPAIAGVKAPGVFDNKAMLVLIIGIAAWLIYSKGSK